ncbi:MAG: septum site-determining protein MinC [Lachnospiraceae bacterium]|nr:septum site-determining protein MinC [Lachnospiraceae bacterium]
MNQSVMIKGNKYGLTLWLDPEIQYEELIEEIMRKFQVSAAFFNFSKPIALRFEGKELNHNQISEILEGISQVTSLQIAYIIDEDSAIETKFQQLMAEKEIQKEELVRKRLEEEKVRQKPEDGMFYRGTLRSGQSIQSDSSIVVLGDVNPGATVSAKGNVVVLGALKGYAYAGTDGNDNTVIVALEMKPMQIRIGNQIARNSDEEMKKSFFMKKKKKKVEATEPQMAFVENGHIYVEPVSKSLIHELMI